MASPRKQHNRRKRSEKARLAVIVSAGMILLAVAGYFLSKKWLQAPPPPPDQKSVVIKEKIPERPEPPPLLSNLTTHPPRAERPVATRRRQHHSGGGKVAIIVDDMGASMSEVRTLMAPGIPLSFSVIPGLAHARQVAEEAHRKGFQVMIHMPMEPQGYPQQRLEKNGLFLSMQDNELTERVKQYLETVPYAVGANNHMGSRFTEDKKKMGAVLGVMQGRALFFIDSRTTPQSVACSTAREMGIRTACRDVFLDNDQDVAAIKKQLAQLCAMARKKGMAIGICHPHKKTMQALTEAMPLLEQEGITFVYASEMVN